MDEIDRERELTQLAAKYIWWTPPERVVRENVQRLVAQVMELGTWEDTNVLIDCVGERPFLALLENPPSGIVSDKSLAFWHIRLVLLSQIMAQKSFVDSLSDVGW
jgi:hypothetical protein